MKPDNDVVAFVAQVSQKLARNPSRSHLIKAGNLTPAAAATPAPVPGPTNVVDSAKHVAPTARKDPVAVVAAIPTSSSGSQTKIKVTPIAPQPAVVKTPETTKAVAPSTKECKGGCGFFGHEGNDGYCSQCYKKIKGTPTTPVASASTSTTPAAAAVTASPKTEKKVHDSSHLSKYLNTS